MDLNEKKEIDARRMAMVSSVPNICPTDANYNMISYKPPATLSSLRISRQLGYVKHRLQFRHDFTSWTLDDALKNLENIHPFQVPREAEAVIKKGLWSDNIYHIRDEKDLGFLVQALEKEHVMGLAFVQTPSADNLIPTPALMSISLIVGTFLVDVIQTFNGLSKHVMPLIMDDRKLKFIPGVREQAILINNLFGEFPKSTISMGVLFDPFLTPWMTDREVIGELKKKLNIPGNFEPEGGYYAYDWNKKLKPHEREHLAQLSQIPLRYLHRFVFILTKSSVDNSVKWTYIQAAKALARPRIYADVYEDTVKIYSRHIQSPKIKERVKVMGKYLVRKMTLRGVSAAKVWPAGNMIRFVVSQELLIIENLSPEDERVQLEKISTNLRDELAPCPVLAEHFVVPFSKMILYGDAGAAEFDQKRCRNCWDTGHLAIECCFPKVQYWRGLLRQFYPQQYVKDQNWLRFKAREYNCSVEEVKRYLKEIHDQNRKELTALEFEQFMQVKTDLKRPYQLMIEKIVYGYNKEETRDYRGNHFLGYAGCPPHDAIWPAFIPVPKLDNKFVFDPKPEKKKYFLSAGRRFSLK